MNLFSLDGQVALVTGSTRGIGRAIVARMAEAGARVVVSSRSRSDSIAVAQLINKQLGIERAVGIVCDVADPNELEQLVDATVQCWGRLDALVCNAGATGHGVIEKADQAIFEEAFRFSVSNNATLARLAAARMADQGGGSIVFISSSAGIVPLEDYPVYCAAKAALNQLASVLAVHWGPKNIRVNAIAPGIIRTEGNHHLWERSDKLQLAVGRTALQRIGEPDEIAACAIYLCSPGGAFATGQTFIVDGGQVLRGADGVHDVIESFRAEQRVGKGR